MSLKTDLAARQAREPFGDDAVPDAVAAAYSRAERARLPSMRPPAASELALPDNVTEISDKEVGSLYGRFSAMVAYATTLSATAAIRHAEATLRAKRAAANAICRAGGSTVTARKREADLDPRVVETTNLELVAQAEATLFRAKLDEYLCARDAMSREISRRQGLAERNLR